MRTSLQADITADDHSSSKPRSGMKLTIIEEPQKAILEPLSEVVESPPDNTPVGFTLGGGGGREDLEDAAPAPPMAPRRGSKARQAVTEPPSAEVLLTASTQKKPLERKKSEDKKTKRIRTKSRVETAI